MMGGGGGERMKDILEVWQVAIGGNGGGPIGFKLSGYYGKWGMYQLS